MVIFIGAEFEGSQRAELGELTFRWYLLTFVAVYWNSHKIICNALHFISSGEHWWFALNAHCLRCFLCVWCNSIFSRFTWSDSLFDLAHVLIFCRSFSTFLFSLFYFYFLSLFPPFFSNSLRFSCCRRRRRRSVSIVSKYRAILLCIFFLSTEFMWIGSSGLWLTTL